MKNSYIDCDLIEFLFLFNKAGQKGASKKHEIVLSVYKWRPDVARE